MVEKWYCDADGCMDTDDQMGDYVSIEDYEEMQQELTEANGKIDELKKLIPDVATDEWWCPVCKQALGWQNVTNEERCDTCGHYLTYCQIDTDEIERLKAIANKNGGSDEEV